MAVGGVSGRFEARVAENDRGIRSPRGSRALGGFLSIYMCDQGSLWVEKTRRVVYERRERELRVNRRDEDWGGRGWVLAEKRFLEIFC